MMVTARRAAKKRCPRASHRKGSLLLGLGHVERFLAVAALEPAIVPGLTWDEVKPKHLFFYSPRYLGQLHGSPVDSEHWAANNPASIVHSDPDGIRDSALQIYFETGDRGGPRNSDRLLRWDPDPGEGVWNATKETELSG